MAVSEVNKNALALLLTHVAHSWARTVDIILDDDADIDNEELSKILVEEDDFQVSVLRTTVPCLVSFLADNPTIFRGPYKRKTQEMVVLLFELDSEEFRKDLRINRSTFDFVVTELSPLLVRVDRGPGKPRLSAPIQVAGALWYEKLLALG